MSSDNPASRAAPPHHWAVTVCRDGEEVVTIETNCLSGREISAADEEAIRTAATHLLAFIGDGASPITPGDGIEEVRLDEFAGLARDEWVKAMPPQDVSPVPWNEWPDEAKHPWIKMVAALIAALTPTAAQRGGPQAWLCSFCQFINRPDHEVCSVCKRDRPSAPPAESAVETHQYGRTGKHPDDMLPDCMMPDGGEACAGYQHCRAALADLERQNEAERRAAVILVAKAAKDVVAARKERDAARRNAEEENKEVAALRALVRDLYEPACAEAGPACEDFHRDHGDDLIERALRPTTPATGDAKTKSAEPPEGDPAL